MTEDEPQDQLKQAEELGFQAGVTAALDDHFKTPPKRADFIRDSLDMDRGRTPASKEFGKPRRDPLIIENDERVDLTYQNQFITVPKEVAARIRIANSLDPSGKSGQRLVDEWKVEANARRDALAKRVLGLGATVKDLERSRDGLGEIIEWFDAHCNDDGSMDMVLGNITESWWHKAQANYALASESMVADPEHGDMARKLIDGAEAQSFFVTKDWAKLTEGTDADSGEYRLPYDQCVFEFDLSGRRVCLLVLAEDGLPRAGMVFWHTRNYWMMMGVREYADGGFFMPGDPGKDVMVEFLTRQVRAICIMLEAEVMEREVIRAPSDQNRKRVKHGHTKIVDHHVLSIARRHRSSRREEAEPTGRKVRLHFRRGHWRHFATHKTWIKWQLVGNADLGFAVKEYSA